MTKVYQKKAKKSTICKGTPESLKGVQDIGDAAQIPHIGGPERPIQQRRNHSQASLLPTLVGTIRCGQSLCRRTFLRRRPSPSPKRPAQIPEFVQGRSLPQSNEKAPEKLQWH